MATEVVMPQMGESIAEGTITKWLVKPGDSVERDQPLFEISTDKVDAEIPSPAAGTLLEIRHQEGETVEVDKVVAVIGAEGEAGATEAAPTAAPAQSTESTEPEAAAPAPEPAPAPAAETPSDSSSDAGSMAAFASPVVKKIAEEENVDLSQVEGTGVSGRVTKKDIMGYIESRGQSGGGEQGLTTTTPAAASPAAPASPAPAPTPAPAGRRDPGEFFVPAYTAKEEVEIEPMSKIRQITAAHMTYSKATSAHVTTVYHYDLSGVYSARNRAKRKFAKVNGTKLTYMPFIFKAVASALKALPKANASVDGTNIVYKKHINLGMAVAMDRGLIVPVIRDADTLSLVGLAKTANDLADRARNKKLRVDETQGGTFTVTNPGVFGSLFGTPVINQPQVAILGLGTIEKRPVVITDARGNDAISIKVMSYFALTYDHRLIDGADAEQFMNHMKDTLENEDWKELEPYY